VFFSPFFQIFLRILQEHEPVRVQASLPQTSAYRFDVADIGRGSWSGEMWSDFPAVCSGSQNTGDKPRAVVYLDVFRIATIYRNLLKNRTAHRPERGRRVSPVTSLMRESEHGGRRVIVGVLYSFSFILPVCCFSGMD